MVCLVRELIICSQDAAFLPSRASVSTTFLKNCGRDDGLRTTTCLTTVVGDKQGHAPCKIISLQQHGVGYDGYDNDYDCDDDCDSDDNDGDSNGDDDGDSDGDNGNDDNDGDGDDHNDDIDGDGDDDGDSDDEDDI